MNRIDKLFSGLRSEKRRALMPFVTAGDPDLATTAMLINELVSRGAHLIEVGIPYSDPIAGITGERKSLPSELVETVGWLRTQTDLPICIGFGISGPDQVRQLAPVADGLIIGSAIVRRLSEAINRPRTEVVDRIGQFVGELAKVLENAGP